VKGEIVIKALNASVHLGVPDEERADRQEVSIDVVFALHKPFKEMADDLSQTVDYADLAAQIVTLAEESPRELLETLAADLLQLILSDQKISRASIEIRKSILENTDFVAVRLADQNVERN